MTIALNFWKITAERGDDAAVVGEGADVGNKKRREAFPAVNVGAGIKKASAEEIERRLYF